MEHPPMAKCPMCLGWGTRGDFRHGMIAVIRCELCNGVGATVAPDPGEDED